jgi:hypothetical protein
MEHVIKIIFPGKFHYAQPVGIFVFYLENFFIQVSLIVWKEAKYLFNLESGSNVGI